MTSLFVSGGRIPEDFVALPAPVVPSRNNHFGNPHSLVTVWTKFGVLGSRWRLNFFFQFIHGGWKREPRDEVFKNSSNKSDENSTRNNSFFVHINSFIVGLGRLGRGGDPGQVTSFYSKALRFAREAS